MDFRLPLMASFMQILQYGCNRYEVVMKCIMFLMLFASQLFGQWTPAKPSMMTAPSKVKDSVTTSIDPFIVFWKNDSLKGAIGHRVITGDRFSIVDYVRSLGRSESNIYRGIEARGQNGTTIISYIRSLADSSIRIGGLEEWIKITGDSSVFLKPIKLSVNALLATPIVGLFEFDGNHVFITRSNGTRDTLATGVTQFLTRAGGSVSMAIPTDTMHAQGYVVDSSWGKAVKMKYQRYTSEGSPFQLTVHSSLNGFGETRQNVVWGDGYNATSSGVRINTADIGIGRWYETFYRNNAADSVVEAHVLQYYSTAGASFRPIDILIYRNTSGAYKDYIQTTLSGNLITIQATTGGANFVAFNPPQKAMRIDDGELQLRNGSGPTVLQVIQMTSGATVATVDTNGRYHGSSFDGVVLSSGAITSVQDISMDAGSVYKSKGNAYFRSAGDAYPIMIGDNNGAQIALGASVSGSAKVTAFGHRTLFNIQSWYRWGTNGNGVEMATMDSTGVLHGVGMNLSGAATASSFGGVTMNSGAVSNVADITQLSGYVIQNVGNLYLRSGSSSQINIAGNNLAPIGLGTDNISATTRIAVRGSRTVRDLVTFNRWGPSGGQGTEDARVDSSGTAYFQSYCLYNTTVVVDAFNDLKGTWQSYSPSSFILSSAGYPTSVWGTLTASGLFVAASSGGVVTRELYYSNQTINGVTRKVLVGDTP
jgi:hypothetical protein